MDPAELMKIINRGEDGKHQFKVMMENADSLAAEMVAFSNSQGGIIIIGVDDEGCVVGLNAKQIQSLNQLISNTASNNIQPPINPITENIEIQNGLVMAVTVPMGISKPYMDNKGLIWMKNGADKRKVSSREELQRLFQSSGIVHGDEIPANGLEIADLDIDYFKNFYNKQYGMDFEEEQRDLGVLLKNMNLCQGNQLNVTGALVFARTPQYRLPAFIVKAVSYPGNEIHQNNYIESADFEGKLENIYRGALAFLMRQNRWIQGGQSVNSQGVPEIPQVVFEEILANALIHRDYFISAPIRIFCFADRVEIISPGHLPNNLTIENIIHGNSNMRNPILASFASKIIPYRGLGNGIRRALSAYPHIEFTDNREDNLFIVTIKRMG